MRYDLPVVKFEHILPFVVNWAQLQGEFKEGKTTRIDQAQRPISRAVHPHLILNPLRFQRSRVDKEVTNPCLRILLTCNSHAASARSLSNIQAALEVHVILRLGY